MKKYFSTPIEAQKSTPKEVAKILKKIIETAPSEPLSFLCKAEFKYAKGGTAPFMYLGELSTAWKEYAKQAKTDKDFMGGHAKVDLKKGKLMLKVSAGKGDKSAFIKDINKQLLKLSSVTIELVDSLDAAPAAAKDSPEVAKAKKEAETYAMTVNQQMNKFYDDIDQGNLMDPRKMGASIKELQQQYKKWQVLAKKNKYAEEGAKVMREMLVGIGDQWKSLSPLAVEYYKKDQALVKAIKGKKNDQIWKLMQELQELDNKIAKL